MTDQSTLDMPDADAVTTQEAAPATKQLVPIPPGRAVGYRQPPSQHRFQKGSSGNPRGRPRKIKPARRQADPLAVGGQPANQLLLAEAYRPVTVREGDRVIQLPAIQAVFRSMGVAAMKGNRFAQKTLADIVRTVEEEDRKLLERNLEEAMEYKLRGERELRDHRKAGLPEPPLLPHPDDIIIDLRAGTVRVDGPMTLEEKKEWDFLLKRRAEAQSEVNCCANEYRRVRKPHLKEFCRDEWHDAQLLFDLINDGLPQRYKAELENRSYAAGTSQPGRALELMAQKRRAGKAEDKKKRTMAAEGS